MSDWEVVDSRNRKGKAVLGDKLAKTLGQTVLNAHQLRLFLSTFKTHPCDIKEERHDFRLCHGYHNEEKDRRRDPYKEIYALADSINDMEKMYHPSLFRTTTCIRWSNSACIFGELCAYAHSSQNIRDRAKATFEYEQETFKPVLERQYLTSFVPKQVCNATSVKNPIHFGESVI